MAWRNDAACLSYDPELFFPISEIGSGSVQLAEAQQVCAACPVAQNCREWALKHGADYGVWGGLGEAERRGLRRRSGRGKLTAQAGGS